MKEGKLVQVIESLGHKERKHFAEYLNSPFFGAAERHRQLFELLTERLFYLGTDPQPLELWSQLFDAEEFDEGAFRTLCSQLLKKAEDYLVQTALQRDDVLVRHILIDEFNRRSLDKHMHYTLHTARKLMDSTPHRDSEYFHDLFRLEIAQHNLNRRQDFRSKKLAPQAALQALDAYYLSSKLRHSCEMINLQRILAIDYEIALLDEVAEFVQSHDYASIPSIAAYYHVLRMLRDQQAEVHYRELRALLDLHGAVFPNAERWELYVYAINFCIRQANTGRPEYLDELFALYRDALENELLYEDGALSPSHYKNIVAVGLRVGAYDWVRSFIRGYRKRLPAAYQRNAYTYNLAKYHYALGHHEKVLELLREVEYDDIFYNLDSKTMLLKIYYEQEEVDALFSLFDSFSVFLRRNKLIAADHKTTYLNLIRFAKRLASLPDGPSVRLERLRQRIEETRAVIDIGWLLDKVDEKKTGKRSGFPA